LQVGENPPYACDRCNGTGRNDEGEIGNINETLNDRLDAILEVNYSNNIFATYNIIEATVASEYNVLSDANKDAYRQIISCGVVDLSDGTEIRTKLWNIFDENSTTRASLITLLGE